MRIPPRVDMPYVDHAFAKFAGGQQSHRSLASRPVFEGGTTRSQPRPPKTHLHVPDEPTSCLRTDHKVLRRKDNTPSLRGRATQQIAHTHHNVAVSQTPQTLPVALFPYHTPRPSITSSRCHTSYLVPAPPGMRVTRRPVNAPSIPYCRTLNNRLTSGV